MEQSFSSRVKSEICQSRVDKKCCALAECYGIVLFCNSFDRRELRIITASADFAARLPKLFKRSFGISFDKQPAEPGAGKSSFVITDPAKLRRIFEAYGADPEATLSHHINLAVLEEDCCRLSFIRGAFLAGGSVTDPEKRYHLELSTAHRSVSREAVSLLMDMGFEPRESQRAGNALLYFKQADAIADLLTSVSAPITAMDVMTAKVEKEMRNTVTRQINCDSANADKTVAAAGEQMAAIRILAKSCGLDELPEPLRDAALLRIANPEASLSDLALLSFPPVSKSCLNHRLKKLIKMSEEYGEAEPQ